MSRPPAASVTRRTADVTVLVLLAAFVALYCVDAVRASTDVSNLILVLPLSIVALVLCAVELALTAAGRRGGAPADAGEGAALSAGAGSTDTTTAPLPAETPATFAAEPPAGLTAAEPAGDGAAGEIGVAALFAAYILSLPWLGFDVGTGIFLAVFLRMQGERRWTWLLGYSVAFALTLAYAFSRLLPYDMPLRLLGAA